MSHFSDIQAEKIKTVLLMYDTTICKAGVVNYEVLNAYLESENLVGMLDLPQ